MLFFVLNMSAKNHEKVQPLGGQNCIFLLGGQNRYDGKHRGPKVHLRMVLIRALFEKKNVSNNL